MRLTRLYVLWGTTQWRSKPLWNEEVASRIDLADLIEREQVKTLENLSEAIESLQARLMEDLETLGWRRSTSYRRSLVTKLGRMVFIVVKVKRGERVFSPIIYALDVEKREYSRKVRMHLTHGCTARKIFPHFCMLFFK